MIGFATQFAQGGVTMPEAVYLVFTRPPEGVDAEAFEQWHDANARRVLNEPAVQAMRCFTMAPDVGTISPIMYTHMALYKGPDTPADASPFLGQPPAEASAPGWASDVRTASFYGYALDEPVELARLDHMYLVFTKPPAEVSIPDFFDWYVRHKRENLTAEGFDAAWRYRLERDVVDPLAPAEAVHAALYEVHGELPELRASLDRAEADGRVVFPEWWPGMRLACLDCYAIADPITSNGDPARR